MSLHTFKVVQKLPVSVNRAWDFISSPANLQEITPSNLGFKITTGINDPLENPYTPSMYQGIVIGYTVKPILGIPIKWVTEITHIEKPYFFVDEQRFGPYKFWHHKHFLKEIDNGVEMTDVVHYMLPFGFIGDIINTLFVKNELKKIFDYRFDKLEQMFGKF